MSDAPKHNRSEFERNPRLFGGYIYRIKCTCGWEVTEYDEYDAERQFAEHLADEAIKDVTNE